MHARGVHATVAGVLLGLLVPVSRERRGRPRPAPLAERIEHRLRPFSAGFAVPVFAFFAAGVTVVGGGLGAAFADPAALGVVVGLVVGKAVGVFGGTWAVRPVHPRRARRGPRLDRRPRALPAGRGGLHRVACSIGELAFGRAPGATTTSSSAILVGSVIAALLAAVVLRLRNRHYRLIEADETRDDDGDGVPDVLRARTGGGRLRAATGARGRVARVTPQSVGSGYLRPDRGRSGKPGNQKSQR